MFEYMDLLQIEDLTLSAGIAGENCGLLLDSVSLRIRENQITCLVGESGAGKTLLGRTIVSLLPPEISVVSGTFRFRGAPMDLCRLRSLRGNSILFLPQEASSSLNPVLKIKRQFTDFGKHSQEDMIAVLARFGFDDPERILLSYPCQLSGGEAQRCLLAMAALAKPELLILDEPLRSLDEDLQLQVAGFIQALQRESGITVCVISHNVRVMMGICHYIYVILQGKIVEEGTPERMLAAPEHPYTAGIVRLLGSYR